MAECLQVSRSGYYKSLTEKPPSTRIAADEILEKRIVEVHTKFRRCYGVDRIEKELVKENVRAHRRRILRLMKKHGIRGKLRVRTTRTTDSAHDFPISPNLLRRNFSAPARDRAWVSDITYIWTREGWLYLCTILDLYSRKIVGWAMSDSLATDFVIDALRMAVRRRRPAPGLIFHSDRGVQYASNAFRAELHRYGMTQSMSGKGQCLDNAAAESFFATLKTELDANRFWNRAEASREVFDYIEFFYNTVRSHSYLGYVSPDEFEKLNAAA
jgi:transposase InsO family protein